MESRGFLDDPGSEPVRTASGQRLPGVLETSDLRVTCLGIPRPPGERVPHSGAR